MNRSRFEGQLGTQRVGTAERSGYNTVAEPKVYLWQTRRDWARTVESDGTRVVKHQDWRISVSIWCQLGQRWREGGQARVWLFTPGSLPMTGWFQAEGLIIWRDLKSAVTVRSYSIYCTVLHLFPPSKTYTRVHCMAPRVVAVDNVMAQQCVRHFIGAISPDEDSISFIDRTTEDQQILVLPILAKPLDSPPFKHELSRQETLRS